MKENAIHYQNTATEPTESGERTFTFQLVDHMGHGKGLRTSTVTIGEPSVDTDNDGVVDVSESTIKRLGKELGVESRRTSEVPPQTEWRLSK